MWCVFTLLLTVISGSSFLLSFCGGNVAFWICKNWDPIFFFFSSLLLFLFGFFFSRCVITIYLSHHCTLYIYYLLHKYLDFFRRRCFVHNLNVLNAYLRSFCLSLFLILSKTGYRYLSSDVLYISFIYNTMRRHVIYSTS